MENLKDLLRQLQKFRIELKLEYNDNAILENAVKIFISQNIENGWNNKPLNNPIGKPATEKQVILLKKIGLYKEGITSKEAWEIINKSKGEQ